MPCRTPAAIRRDIVDELHHRAPFVRTIVARHVGQILENDDVSRQIMVGDVFRGASEWRSRLERARGAVVAVGQHADADPFSCNTTFAPGEVCAQRAIALRDHRMTARHRQCGPQEFEAARFRHVAQRRHGRLAGNRRRVNHGVLEAFCFELRAQAGEVVAIGADGNVALARAQRG